MSTSLHEKSGTGYEFSFLDKKGRLLHLCTIRGMINDRSEALYYARLAVLEVFGIYDHLNGIEEGNNSFKFSLIYLLNRIRRIRVIDNKGNEHKFRMKEIT